MKRAAVLGLILLPMAASAQLLPQALPRAGDLLGRAGGSVGELTDLPRSVAALASDRLTRLTALVRANPREIALDDAGDPARAGEVLVIDADDVTIASAAAAGFRLAGREDLDGLDLAVARFSVPPGQSLAQAVRRLRKLAPDKQVSADQLHFASGTSGATAPPAAVPAAAPPGARIGIIDGGVSGTAGIGGTIMARGFATGAPHPSDHASAIAALLFGTGGASGTALNADVYGTDPAGGGALAIARALAWLSASRVPVTVISLVGPANPLLARAVAAAQGRGMIVVAAVGNDGPAAPPAFPASYPGVIAVTGVDAKNRALIEAGHALHLDYAAPGADLIATGAKGRAMRLRGTSFAAPLAAARIVRFHRVADPAGIPAALRAADAEAVDLGPRGADRRFGRGLLCGGCRTPAR